MHNYIRLSIVIKGTSELVNTKLHPGHGYTSADVNAPDSNKYASFSSTLQKQKWHDMTYYH